jgi:hypothetical protein
MVREHRQLPKKATAFTIKTTKNCRIYSTYILVQICLSHLLQGGDQWNNGNDGIPPRVGRNASPISGDRMDTPSLCHIPKTERIVSRLPPLNRLLLGPRKVYLPLPT